MRRPKRIVRLGGLNGVEQTRFAARLQADRSTPGRRLPVTAERDTFAEARELGRSVRWLRPFGKRRTDRGKAAPPKQADGNPLYPES